MTRRLLMGGLLGISLMASGVNGTIRNVNLNDSTISPANFTAARGDTVRFTVVSGIHYLASDSTSPRQWQSDTLSGMGASFDYIIDTTGTHRYRCLLHPAIMYQFMVPASCCIAPIRGDWNTNGAMGVIDLNGMIAYMFQNSGSLICFAEADVNADGAFNILDLNRMIAYFFSGGPAPAPCP